MTDIVGALVFLIACAGLVVIAAAYYAVVLAFLAVCAFLILAAAIIAGVVYLITRAAKIIAGKA